MNGWKSCFFSGVFFFSGLKKSSELMTCALFHGKKKHKNTQKFGRKKKTQPTFVEKKIGLPQNPNEWQMNISWKKKTQLVFFPLSGNKKKQHFRILMNEWPMNFSREKKYDTFGTTLDWTIFSLEKKSVTLPSPERYPNQKLLLHD